MHINKLTIHTQHLNQQVDFYSKTLGWKLVSRSDDRASFQVGRSVLVLKQSEQFTPYHFAINIPGNQENEALAWLKERVPILKDGEHEIQDFDFWNAMAIYFYDHDQNIVEFIARKNLNHDSDEAFGVHSLLEISEIGVPVDDIEKTVTELKRISGIAVFDGNFERFCAVGDEHGLFICINKQVKDWFPTDDKAYSSEFQLLFEENDRAYEVAFRNGQVSLLS